MQKKLHHKFHTKLISYDQFMEYKLYDKNEGYYSVKNQELWGIDYSTSPIVHSAFGFLIAKYIYAVWISMNSPGTFSLIEIGGGNLNFINNIFDGIKKLSPKFADLLNIMVIDRNFKNNLQRHKNIKLINCDSFNLKNITGVVISNELFDALPFKRLINKKDKFYEIFVNYCNDFEEQELEIKYNPFSKYPKDIYSIPGKVFTYSPSQKKMIEDIAVGMKSGVVLTIDYGYFFNDLKKNKNLMTDARIIKKQNIVNNIYSEDLVDISSFVNFNLLIDWFTEFGFDFMFSDKQSKFLQDLDIVNFTKSYLKNAVNMAEALKYIRTLEDLIDDDIFGDYLVLGVSKGLSNFNHNLVLDKLID